MIWLIVIVAVIGFVWWVNATASGRDAQKALDIIGDSHSLMTDHFPYPRLKTAWQDIICVETAYLTLIVFVHGMTLDGINDNQKKSTVEIITDRWCEFILEISTLPNTPRNINIVKQKIQQKQSVYIPLIDKYFNEISQNSYLRNNPEIITKENYALYEKFIEFALENYQKIMSNEYSVLKFHRNPADINNSFTIQNNLSHEEGDARQNQQNYYQDLRKEGKGNSNDIQIDKRTKFIRHHIMILLSCCNQYRIQNNYPIQRR